MSCVASGPFGAFPDCDGLGASVFLNIVYGCGLLLAAQLISDGSELLLEVLSPGLVGGLLLPILGAVPDAAVIVASGLGASGTAQAQAQVAVGMGTLAGSTVMLLTVAWGGSLWVGRCDLDAFTGKAVQRSMSHPGFVRGLAKTGVTVDNDTTLNAKIMMGSCLVFLVPQIAALCGDDGDGAVDATGAGVAFAALLAYCAFQVMHPELQRRKMAAARVRRANLFGAHLAHHIGASVGGILVDGEINAVALDVLFDQFDSDGNGQIETHELKAALVAMSVTMKDYNVTDNDVKTWLAAFDRDGDGLISRAEFCGGMTHWVLEQTSGGLEQHRPGRLSRDGAGGYDRVDDRISTAREGTEPLLRYDGAPASPGAPRFPFRDHGAGSDCDETSDDETSDDDAGNETDNETPPTRGQIVRQSVTRLAAGMVLIALFADPMVGAVSSLSSALGLRSPFFASFVITPFASNASELVSSLYFASKKRKKNISLTYSQIYGAVTMNNTMCLGLFLVVMRARGLRWTFTSETITIVVATFAVGFVGARRKTLKTSLLLPVMCIYPAALGLVAFLDGVLGLQ